MDSYVSRLILAGCLLVPCLAFGQVTIECIVNQTVTAAECNDCTNITDSVFVKFGLRCINGADTTILEGPVRIKARGSSGDVVMFDYRANPPQGSTQTFFFNVSAAAQFGDIQDVFAYVRDCASFLVDYGDSTKRVHWGDTMFVTYPELEMAPGDTTGYYWWYSTNGGAPDTVVMSEGINFVQSGQVTITQGPTNLTWFVPNMFDTCFHTLTQLTDSTAQLTDCNGLGRGTVTFSANTGASLSDSCVQHLYALPDSSNRLILTDCEGNPMDTVDFFGIGLFNDFRLDSLRYSDDTLTAYIRDTSGIVDSIKVEIVLGDTDTDIDSMKLIGNVLHLWEDEVHLTTDLSQFLDNTDDQQVTNFNFNDGTRVLTLEIENDGQAPHTVTIPDDTGTDDQQLSLVTDGLIDTIFLEDGGFVVLHDSVGVGQPDTYLDSIRHIIDGQIDSIWFYRDSTGHLVDSFLVVLHDSVGTNTNDTYLSATWCSGDTLYSERSDTSGIIDTLIIAGIPCSRDTCDILIEQITSGSAFGYSLVTGLRYTYCDIVDSVCFVGTIKYIPYYHLDDTLYFLTEEIIDCDDVDFGLYKVYIDPGNDIRVDTAWFVDDTLYQQRVDNAGVLDTIITEIRTGADYDFIRLDGDTMVTIVDTLLPKDSADLHKLIWHGGRVRLGLPAYEHSIYLDTTSGDYLNFVLHQDSVDTGLQIFGRRSALDIYHHTRPYIHHRNQFGEFWQRIFDPTAEGPLEPQRWEVGAVGKYDSDTTSRAIFTITNDADAYSLNITPNFLQSDIYKSDRAPDAGNVNKIFAADSSGRFVLVDFDSIGDINIISEPDHDWYVWGGTSLATNITQNIYTEGKAYVGDGVNSSQFQFQILHDTNSYAFRTATSENYSEWMMELQNEEDEGIAWFHAAQSNTSRRDWRITNDAGPTAGVYAVFKEGYDESLNPAFVIKSDGDIGFGQYKETRDDLEPASAITNMIYMSDDAITSESFGVMKMASIDSLAAALQLTGIIASADSLGRNGTAGRVVLETATKAPQSTANLFFDVASTELGVGTSTPAQTIHVQGTARITGSDGTATTVMGRDADGDVSTVALGTNLSITAGTLNAASTADLLGTAFPTDEVLIGTNTTTGASTPDFTYNRTSGSASRKIWLNSGAIANIEMGFASGGISSTNRPQFVGYSDGSTGATIPAITFFGGKYAGTYPGSMSNFGDADAALFQLSGGAYRGAGIQTAAQIFIDGDGTMSASGYSGKIRFATATGTGSSPAERMRIDKSGFVGIGQTNPGYLLDVLVPSTTTGGVSITSAGGTGDANLYFQNSVDANDGWRVGRLGNGNFYISYSAGYPYSITSSPFVIEANSPASLLWMDNTSRIGILTTNPQQTLHVAGTARITGSVATPTTITGRNGSGDIGNVAVGSGLLLSSGTLTATTLGTVTSVAAGNGLNFTTITGSGNVTLGTPGSVTLASTNSVSTTSHTHAFAPGGTTAQYIRGDGSLATYSGGNGIYGGSGNIGGGTATVTASVGSSFNFIVQHQSENKLVIGTSGTFLRGIASGGSVHVGENGSEWVFSHNGTSGSGETRMHAVNFGANSRFEISDAGAIALKTLSGTNNILLQATGNVHLNSTAEDVILSSGGGAGDVVEIGGFDYVNLSASATGGYIEMVPASGSHGALYVLGSAGNLHISNAPATSGSADYITFTPSGFGFNVNAGTVISAQTGNVELHGGVTGTYGLEVAGSQASSTATTFTLVSDRRQKENIVSIGDAFEKITALNPVTFNYNEAYRKQYNQENKLRRGFIAQDYQKVFPEDVDENEGILSMNLDAVIPYSVAAIQQLIRDNEEMKSRIEALEKLIKK